MAHFNTHNQPATIVLTVRATLGAAIVAIAAAAEATGAAATRLSSGVALLQRFFEQSAFWRYLPLKKRRSEHGKQLKQLSALQSSQTPQPLRDL